MNLNTEQKKVIETNKNSICVLAGPGSGKTHSIIERIAHVIETEKMPRERILAVTFTNKAANEMRSRIKTRCGAPLPAIFTFHALALKIIKENDHALDLNPNWQIIEEKEQQKIVNEIVKKSKCKIKNPLLAITQSKTCRKKDKKNDDFLTEYARILKEKNMIDFDDVLLHAKKLLEAEADIRDRWNKKYKHIIVDEYQDTNPIQAQILKLLSTEDTVVCVVGDPHQAIYSFRGATLQNFFVFKDEYADTETIELKKNYRSTDILVKAGNALQKRNLEADTTRTGERIKVFEAENPQNEAYFIVKTIKELIGGIDLNTYKNNEQNYHMDDIAVLYRTNMFGRELEKTFIQNSIPYKLIGARTLFDYPEIKEILEKVKKIEIELPLKELIESIIKKYGLKEKYDTTKKGKKIYDRILALKNHIALLNHLNPKEAKEALLTESKLFRPEDEEQEINKVTLLTAHAAKGLEFSVVFIAGAEEGFFPYYTEETTISNEDFEEEKRLFYVALTRAKEKVFITWSKTRTVFGQTTKRSPSRFLSQIPPECIEVIRQEKKKKSSQMKLI